MSLVEVSTLVKGSPHRAFEAFTAEVDRWWLRGPRYRAWSDSELRFADGALLEQRGVELRRLAEVSDWQPGALLGLTLAGESVRIDFSAEGERTRVTVRHQRESPLTAFQDPVGLYWADLLGRLASSLA